MAAGTAKKRAELAARLRVPTGFVVALLFAVYSHPRRQILPAGLLIALGGLALRAWAAGCLAKNTALATGGPFAYTRNPLYLGTLIVAAGFALAAWNPWLAVLFAAYFALVYLPVIAEEESHLRNLFPEYASYARQTPRLWPRPARSTAAAGAGAALSKKNGGFRWSLYIRNQEYNALLGSLAGAAILLWKIT